MRDPQPDNIYGKKTAGWSVDLTLNVGYTLAALLGLYVAWKLFGGLSGSSSDDDVEESPLSEVSDQ